MIRACIFDLGGTIIDKYSLTPLRAFRQAFKNKHIDLCPDLIRRDMGLNKLDHINKICSDPVFIHNWHNKHLEDVKYYKDEIFSDFNKIQRKLTIENMKMIPETNGCIRYLQDNNILTGVTTGFDYKQTMLIKSLLETYNIYLDSYVSSTCLDLPSRPGPYMIHKNMDNLNLSDSRKIIKIDDTVSGIKEGLNAGCLTVGVARWSINMNINTYEEMMYLDNHIMNGSTDYSLNNYNQNKNLIKSREILKNSGAHYVIDTLDELPNIIEHINSMKEPNPYKLLKS